MKVNNIKMIYFIYLMISFNFLFANVENGKQIYSLKCANCHHPDRIGFSAPPLIPETLEKLNDEKLSKIISKGLPNTLMVGHQDLSDSDIKDLISFLRVKKEVKWTKREIENSNFKASSKEKPLPFKDILNLTAVVERGASKIWLMEDQNILDKFDFSDVHGGIKYSRDYKMFFVPSRDGYVGKYLINQGYQGKIRACISLRNITVSNDNKTLAVSCLYPKQLVLLNQENLKVKKIVPLSGKISGIYTLNNEDIGVFTYRDIPEIGYFDFKNLKLTMKKIKEPVEDFFIDPLDQYMISSSRNGSNVSVIDLSNQSIKFEKEISGMPHLSSASYWYDKGEFYFATFHIKSNYISVWKMYKWEHVKNIEVGGNGFFVRSHPGAPHLWIDNGSDEVVLIDKKSLEVTKFKPAPGKKFTHTEFSKDGSIAYLSIFEKDGSLILYDTATIKELKQFPISFPVGKYNVVNKEREFLPINLGQSVFMAKCWGCHHQESAAFGPSFKKIATNLSKDMIRTHLDDPKTNAINLGHKNSTMPMIPLTEEEKNMVASYVTSFKVKLVPIKLYNMAEHTLTHPERLVKNCKDYLTWKKLGYDAFSETDKNNEQNYIDVCN